MNNKPSFYQKVRPIGHREVENIFHGPVVVQEKVDGSNFCFGKTRAGELFCMSRSQHIDLDAPGMFAEGVEHVKAVAHRIYPGEAIRAEYLKKPRHNLLAYDRTPKGHLVAFEREVQNGVSGVWNTDPDSLNLAEVCGDLAIDIVPELICIQFLSWDGVKRWVDEQKIFERESFLGGQKIEGIVLKNYERFNEHGSILVAKYVRAEFKEQHQHVKMTERDDPIQAIGHRIGGPARWNKAVQHLRETGQLKDGCEDIPALMKRVFQDVEAEEVDNIKDALFKQFKRAVLKGATQGLPEWYKGQLWLEAQATEHQTGRSDFCTDNTGSGINACNP